MASVVHAQVVIPAASGITRDTTINTFTFRDAADGAEDTVAAAASGWLEDFYNVASGTGVPISDQLNKTRSRVADDCSMRFYNITAHLNGSDAGPPILVTSWTLGAAGSSDGLPDEVALALSFHGDDDTVPEFGPGTRPRSRHRGRVFIGPLIYNVTSNAGNIPVRPTTGLMQSLEDAGSALIVASASDWAVWSRRNAAAYPVIGGWVDNAFDTIRGRGPDPTVKEFWPPPV